MYELRQVTEKVYYIDCLAKIGICLLENGRALLINSGGDKDAGKKALKLLETND